MVQSYLEGKPDQLSTAEGPRPAGEGEVVHFSLVESWVPKTSLLPPLVEHYLRRRDRGSRGRG